MEKEDVEVTLMVSECGKFHNLGEFYENIPTVEEAIAIWKQIPQNECMAFLQSASMFTDREKKTIWMTKLTCYQVTGLIWRY